MGIPREEAFLDSIDRRSVLKAAGAVGLAVAAAGLGGCLVRRERNTSFVITEPCIGVKDKACVEVCPVDCIYEGPNQLFINPHECIECGACYPVCPVKAIFPGDNVPEPLKRFIVLNRQFFVDHPGAQPCVKRDC
jgi:ferredoxin